MADSDALIRLIVLVGFVGAALFVLLGGAVTRVAGLWHDGSRKILIRKWGPLVRGVCQIDGGEERYSGYALFGWVRLDRYATGKPYFVAAGFEAETVPLLREQPLGRFTFWHRNGRLQGTFEGRKFTFAYSPPRIVRVARLPGVARTWTRTS